MGRLSDNDRISIVLNPTRFRIILCLRDSKAPLFIDQIAKAIGVNRRTTSFHLALLERNGLVRSQFMTSHLPKSTGKIARYYSLTEKSSEVVSEIQEALQKHQPEGITIFEELLTSKNRDRALSSLQNAIMKELRETPSAPRVQLATIFKQFSRKAGIQLSEIRMYEESRKHGNQLTELAEIEDLAQIGKDTDIFVEVTCQIDGRNVAFHGRIRTDETGKLMTNAMDVGVLEVTKDEIEDKVQMHQRLDNVQNQARAVLMMVETILNALLRLPRSQKQ